MTNQQCRQMMVRKRVGYWMVNSHCGRKEQEGDFTRAMLSAQLTGGWKVQVSQWNMAKIMIVIGQASCLWNRYANLDFKIKIILTNVLQFHEKNIPKFERLHGPGYQALIMVDNSQGHAAYASNALLVTKMNLNPRGSVPKLRDGWFVHDRCWISQLMVFPIDHPTNPD